MELQWNSTGILIAVATLPLGFLAVKWWKNPLRQIPGPVGIPLLGNVLTLNPGKLHMQFYEMAKLYGPVMKISVLNETHVIVNSIDLCLEALLRKGTDFQGRPAMARSALITPKDLLFMSYDHPHFPILRKAVNSSLKGYGMESGHLENIMQESIAEAVNIIQAEDGQPIEVQKLLNSFLCNVMDLMMFGERLTYDDPMCVSLGVLHDTACKTADPFSAGAIFDLFPFLLRFKFILPSVHRDIEETIRLTQECVGKRIEKAQATFDSNEKRGCIDYFIESQKTEFDQEGKAILDDCAIQGLVLDLVVAGMGTTNNNLSQAFLDLLHDPQLQKRLQSEIDSQFEPTQTITLKDRPKLPFLVSYTFELLRYTNTTPFLLPHCTIRDTEIGGYKIPRGTTVIMNSFYTSHNPEVYEDPFTVKPDRFLDENGKLIEPGHPLRQSLTGFGVGRRSCPGENFAKTRIFLFLANILQKFAIEPVGELPDRDVRNYSLNISMLKPPRFTARFVRRQ